MDEEKKDLPVVGADGVQEPVDPAEAAQEDARLKAEQEAREKTQKQKQDRSRRTVIYGAGGAYLIYLAVQMIRDLIKQTPADWGGTEIAALVASVVFIAAGVLMIVRIALWFKQDMDEKKNHTTDGEN